MMGLRGGVHSMRRYMLSERGCARQEAPWVVCGIGVLSASTVITGDAMHL